MPLRAKRLYKQRGDIQRAAILLAVEELKRKQAKAAEQIWEPLPIQQAPDEDDDSWDTWLLRGGRGSGKTEGASRFVLKHLRKYGSAARVGIGGPTISDARDVCAEGLSGLITIAPDEFNYNRSLLEARHKGGGYVKFLGSEKPDRWNGPQWTLLWADELALWKRESFDQAQFGLRIGRHPRTIISTTPKAKKWVRDIEDDPTTRHTEGTMFENPHISQIAKNKLLRKYKGTYLEKQEIWGQWIEAVAGALWQQDWIDNNRVELKDVPPLVAVCVAIDPAATHKRKDQGDDENSDETGIICAGVGEDDLIYVLHDSSLIEIPDKWARAAIALYDKYQADHIVAEVNNGGDMVEFVLQTVWGESKGVVPSRAARYGALPFRRVWASRGKFIRAEPVAALYAQNRVKHVAGLYELEEQLTTWTRNDDWSPDRLDALVWCITDLAIGGDGEVTLEYDEDYSISPV